MKSAVEIPYKTSPDQVQNIDQLAAIMINDGIDGDFVKKITSFAAFDQGIYELMELFSIVINLDERALIINDIKELMDSYDKPVVVYSLDV